MNVPIFPDDHQTPPVVKPRRNRKSAKSAGARFERAQADWLATRLMDDRIDRRVKRGNQDRGDIGGVRTCRGDRVVIELKDVARVDIPGWLREAEAERGNDDAAIGVVMFKRRGTTNPASQFVVMTAEAFAVLLEGGL
jgi:hypothetical protein